jgi:hypothetical protein
MMDVSAVISEMSGIGIQGFSKSKDDAASVLDVIKKGVKNEDIPKSGVALFRETQERAKIALERMSAIADRISEVSVGLREQLGEADTLLREMDEVSSEYRRIFNE